MPGTWRAGFPGDLSYVANAKITPAALSCAFAVSLLSVIVGRFFSTVCLVLVSRGGDPQRPGAIACSGCTGGPAGGSYTVTVCLTAPQDGGWRAALMRWPRRLPSAGAAPAFSSLTSTWAASTLSMTGRPRCVRAALRLLRGRPVPAASGSPHERRLQVHACRRQYHAAERHHIVPVNTKTFTPRLGTPPITIAAVGYGSRQLSRRLPGVDPDR